MYSNKLDCYPPSPPLSSTSKSPMSKSLSSGWNPLTSDSSSFLNLEKVVQLYGHQPELLELILSSKVEEDRRRAEEAKLRRKEIDYMLQKQQQKSTLNLLAPIPNKHAYSQQEHHQKEYSNTQQDQLNKKSQKQEYLSRQFQEQELLNRKLQQWNNEKVHLPLPKTNKIDMLLSPSDDLKLPEISSHKRSFDGHHFIAAGSAPLSPPSDSVSNSKRRRREMQAISTIIETKEFPYNDDYLWKNNGNTIHKKSGFKSIYYKCSNCTKGCPVNKTVTFRDTGDHLIKYRGQHLPECNRIKRITDL